MGGREVINAATKVIYSCSNLVHDQNHPTFFSHVYRTHHSNRRIQCSSSPGMALEPGDQAPTNHTQ